MSIRKDNRGRVLKEGESQRKDLTYMYRWSTRKGDRKCIYANTLNDLRIKEKSAKLEVLNGISRESHNLNQQIEMYFNFRKDLDNLTVENYTYYYNKFVKVSALGRTKIVNLKKTDVLKFYADCSDSGLANGTIAIMHKFIHPALELAVDDDMILKNPSDKCLKNYPVSKDVKYALTFDEEKEFFSRILSRPRMKRYYTFYALLIKMGLRISEAIGLTWDDVDMHNRMVSINHQVLYRKIKGKMVTYWKDSTKTESGMREFPMTDEIYALFFEQRKLWLASKKDNNFTIDNHVNNFVFLSHQTGKILYASNVRRMMQSLENENEYRDVKLPHITPHILRHTACTRFFESGMDFKTIQYLMGQIDIDTTSKTYNHVDKERAMRELSKVGKLVYSNTP